MKKNFLITKQYIYIFDRAEVTFGQMNFPSRPEMVDRSLVDRLPRILVEVNFIHGELARS